MSEPASETPRYQIIFLNDDFTPMEFVVHILETIFKMDREEAAQAMLNTHRRGTYPVAVLEKTTAEATVNIIHEQARAAGHPFKCVLQEEAAN